ncbi:MAG: tetratricopeptide repeat protein [Candidatus Heimdallarchaeota archaeon]|nr:tetratricopeptide repeat protein [Candidatus Heimdallarchaeota archaeon]
MANPPSLSKLVKKIRKQDFTITENQFEKVDKLLPQLDELSAENKFEVYQVLGIAYFNAKHDKCIEFLLSALPMLESIDTQIEYNMMIGVQLARSKKFGQADDYFMNAWSFQHLIEREEGMYEWAWQDPEMESSVTEEDRLELYDQIIDIFEFIKIKDLFSFIEFQLRMIEVIINIQNGNIDQSLIQILGLFDSFPASIISNSGRLMGKRAALLDQQEIVYITDLGIFYHYLGVCYWLSKDIENAIINFEESIFCQEEAHCLDIKENYFNLGMIYFDQQKPLDALSNLEKALDLIEDHPSHQVSILLSISKVYIMLNNTEKAVEMAKKTNSLAKQYGSGIEVSLSYSVMGRTQLYAQQFDNARLSFENGIPLSEDRSTLLYYLIPLDSLEDTEQHLELLQDELQAYTSDIIRMKYLLSKNYINFHFHNSYDLDDIKAIINLLLKPDWGPDEYIIQGYALLMILDATFNIENIEYFLDDYYTKKHSYIYSYFLIKKHNIQITSKSDDKVIQRVLDHSSGDVLHDLYLSTVYNVPIQRYAAELANILNTLNEEQENELFYHFAKSTLNSLDLAEHFLSQCNIPMLLECSDSYFIEANMMMAIIELNLSRDPLDEHVEKADEYIMNCWNMQDTMDKNNVLVDWPWDYEEESIIPKTKRMQLYQMLKEYIDNEDVENLFDVIVFQLRANEIRPLMREGKFEQALQMNMALFDNMPAMDHEIIADARYNYREQYPNYHSIGIEVYDHNYFYFLLGLIYHFKLEYEDAIIHYHEAEYYAEKYAYFKDLTDIYYSLANTYLGAGDMDTALEYQEKALHIIEKHGDTNDIIYAHISMSDFNYNNDLYVNARSYAQKALLLAQEDGSELHKFQTQYSMGKVEQRIGDFISAMTYYEGCLNCSGKIFDIQKPWILNQLIFISNGLGNYDDSERYLAILHELPGDVIPAVYQLCKTDMLLNQGIKIETEQIQEMLSLLNNPEIMRREAQMISYQLMRIDILQDVQEIYYELLVHNIIPNDKEESKHYMLYKQLLTGEQVDTENYPKDTVSQQVLELYLEQDLVNLKAKLLEIYADQVTYIKYWNELIREKMKLKSIMD